MRGGFDETIWGGAEPEGDQGVPRAGWEPKRVSYFQAGAQGILGSVWIPFGRCPDGRSGTPGSVRVQRRKS